MKRLWVRLSAVAAIVASLGGGSYYFLSSGNAAAEPKEVAENAPPEPPENVVPLPDNDAGITPVFDASPAATETAGDYGQLPTEPAQANWQDAPSQPIIRQVSSNENDGGYPAGSAYAADGGYAANGSYATDTPPPADTTNSYVGDAATDNQPYDPTATYGVTDSSAAATSPAYVETNQPTDGGYGSVGTAAVAPSGGGYGQGALVSPTVTREDLRQPVTAPSFANGETVGDRGPAPAEYGQPDVADSVAPSSPVLERPSPQFDSGPGAAAAAAPASIAAAPIAAAPSYASPPAVTRESFGQSAAQATMAADLVADTPGARTLDGRQTPSISVEKTAPAEIQVGKPAAFKTLVRNTGQVPAKNVVVTDRLPQGTRLVDVTPQPNQAPDGSLVWQFEVLESGEEVLISMEVMPEVEGEIGSQALVTFQAQASVRTICTKPQLLVEHSTAPKALIGEDVVFEITISNPGSGDATGIVLEEDVPQGLTHVAGDELEYEIGTLRPGESRRLELVLKASEAGVTSNKLRVRGDANLLAEHATQLEVIAPKLVVGMSGPQRRYLDRQVKYQVAFGNAGTAMAKNIELATYLPKGLKFLSTSGKGQYDSRDHAVFWSLDQLAPGQEGAVELTAVPIATGEQKLQVEGTADLGQSHQAEHTTLVEAITELVFSVSDTQDPIEVGSETVYEIRIVNNGSKTATNVQVAALLPAELTPISGEGTSRVAVQGQQVIMEPLDRIGPRDEAVYKIKAKGQRAGDHLIDVRLVCDEVPTPVTKQESTKVYADGL